MFGLNRKIHKSVNDGNIVEVIEVDGVRSLYLGSVTVQSSMRVKNPNKLELTYSRGMMCFLLFSDKVKNVLSIGLGGGSVPKFIHAFCPTITQTVVEINPQIIVTARSHFFVPDNDERLNVSCDMALKNDGIFVINLWGSDKNFDIYLRRIEQSFDNNVLMLPTGKPGNIVVFGFKQLSGLRIIKLRERAKNLEFSHKIEFLSFFEKLCEHNPHNNKQFFTH
jgi:spermidine synthase